MKHSSMAQVLRTMRVRGAYETERPSSFRNELDFTPLLLPRLTMSFPHTCSTITPGAVPVTLNVTTQHFPVTLAEVRFQLLDPFRSNAPATIFDSSALTRQFGSVTIGTFAARDFPFTFPLGCLRGAVLQTSVTTTATGGVSRVQTMQMPLY
jgi:hypothetical protein